MVEDDRSKELLLNFILHGVRVITASQFGDGCIRRESFDVNQETRKQCTHSAVTEKASYVNDFATLHRVFHRTHGGLEQRHLNQAAIGPIHHLLRITGFDTCPYFREVDSQCGSKRSAACCSTQHTRRLVECAVLFGLRSANDQHGLGTSVSFRQKCRMNYMPPLLPGMFQ